MSNSTGSQALADAQDAAATLWSKLSIAINLIANEITALFGEFKDLTVAIFGGNEAESVAASGDREAVVERINDLQARMHDLEGQRRIIGRVEARLWAMMMEG